MCCSLGEPRPNHLAAVICLSRERYRYFSTSPAIWAYVFNFLSAIFLPWQGLEVFNGRQRKKRQNQKKEASTNHTASTCLLFNRMGKVVVAMFTIFALLMGAPMDADAARYPRSNTRHNHSQPHDYHANNCLNLCHRAYYRFFSISAARSRVAAEGEWEEASRRQVYEAFSY